MFVSKALTLQAVRSVCLSVCHPRSPALTPKGQRAQTTPSKSPKGNRKSADATIPTGKGGYYSVAQKDFSVLERISQRAHKRAMRVRNPHEVSPLCVYSCLTGYTHCSHFTFEMDTFSHMCSEHR